MQSPAFVSFVAWTHTLKSFRTYSNLLHTTISKLLDFVDRLPDVIIALQPNFLCHHSTRVQTHKAEADERCSRQPHGDSLMTLREISRSLILNKTCERLPTLTDLTSTLDIKSLSFCNSCVCGACKTVMHRRFGTCAYLQYIVIAETITGFEGARRSKHARKRIL